MVTYLSFAEVDFSWSSVVAATPPEQLSLMLPLDDPNLPWLGTLVGSISKPPLEEQVRQFTFHAETMERQASLCWWQDYRLHSLVLVLLATALVLAHG
jgi:hypothetical protein